MNKVFKCFVGIKIPHPCPFSSGPGVNKAVLLQQQQEKEKARKEMEMRNSTKQGYDNKTFDDTEVKYETGFRHANGPSKTSEQEDREERVEHF